MAPDDNHSLRHLAPQSSTSRWRFTRSTANPREAASQSISGPSSGQTKNAPKLARAPSKLSLFNLFSRPKVERARGHTEVGLAVPMRPQTPVNPAIPSNSTLGQNPSPSAQQSIRSRSSIMFRPMPTRPPPPPPDNESGNWEPPPLSQAFPQSIKHATVQACVFPPEVLMRTQSQRRQAELIRERIDSVRDLSVIEEHSTDTKKLEKSHKRLISTSVLNLPTPELVNKIYVLVNAGYVMQYAGDGPFDRRPEKVLKLGKESAAFACDLIPGKHWVLQISSHAHNDGTIEVGPKSGLLSRLRTQNTVDRKAGPSFLLVLESAEEMDAWMTAVRKEIEHNGGQRVKDESIRASSSIDGSSGKQSTETSHRYPVQRDPNAATKITPVDSPHQSFHAIPLKVVTSDYEGSRTERTPSIASSTRDQSARQNIKRQSVEASSVSSTPVSQDQMQLDQLRGRSRFSYMSTATTASGSGTRNTSRDSSPTSQSPLKEGFTPTGDVEPFRQLKSFHSNPSNDTGSRRRSVQPLPITTEDNSMSVEVPGMRQRHSFYGPTSPTLPEPAKPEPEPESAPAAPIEISSARAPPFVAAKGLTAHIARRARSASPQWNDEILVDAAVSTLKDREDSPVRFNSSSYSTISRERTISPPPRDVAPVPPRSAYHQSVGHTLSYVVQAPLKSDPSRQRRISATPKPFLRPFPVRPQAQHTNSPSVVQRRISSAVPASTSPSLSTLANRSVTAPSRSPAAAILSPLPHALTLHSAQSSALRRPTSVQIRSDPTPFLSSIRPALAISSTPSFVPGIGPRASSTTPPPGTNASIVLHSSTSTGALRQQASLQIPAQAKNLMTRKSMPVMGLPPPAPPPDMPLPAPPPNMPLPAPPPNMPLPPPPVSAQKRVVI